MSSKLSNQELTYYARHLRLPEVGKEGQERLKNSSVLLIGLGGLGSPMAMYLAGAGIGKLGLVEFDKVDESNLHRQVLYSKDQIGKSKVQCGKDRLLAINPHIQVITHEETFTAENARDLVKNYDVVADGSDNFVTRYLVNDACVLEDRPLVSASVFRFEGQLSVLHYAGGPCYRCLFPEPPPAGAVPSCAEGGVLGVLPGVMGTLQALEVIKIVLKQGEPLSGRLLHFDALSGQFSQFKFKRQKNCSMCGDHPSLKEVKEISPTCAVATSTNPNIQSINAETLRKKLQIKTNGPAEDFLLVDVREDFERQESAILPSEHIPLNEILKNNFQLPKEKNIILYCRSGARSLRAAEHLSSMGYSRVANLAGGIESYFTGKP